MAYVEPLDRSELEDLEPLFGGVESMMGFVPNSMLTMARMRQLPVAFSLLANTLLGADLRDVLDRVDSLVRPLEDADEALSPGMVQLAAYAASVAAGCRYCQAHTSHNAERAGQQPAQFAEILEAQSSDAFSDAEKAAIAFALAAAAVPNEVDAEHFAALREHFSERQIVQLTGVIALFGFLNRWNDTLATALETPAVDFAEQRLSGAGWQIGKHA